ncbi:MAG: hypothetical protein KGN77_05210 [Xanthomonadaceae bacterium]|nr:hypothetical protein [Xanthomonadaceae bacterium]
MVEVATHHLKLTNGAAIELAVLAGARGLLTKKELIGRVVKFARAHLRKLPEFKGEMAAQADWSEEIFAEVQVRERERDALKALVQSAADNKALACTLGTGDLLAVLGLAEDE